MTSPAPITIRTGSRIRLEATTDPYTGIATGAQGTALDTGTINLDTRTEILNVAWDDGSNLSLIPSAGDRYTVLPDRHHQATFVDDTTDQGYAAVDVDCACGQWQARADNLHAAQRSHLAHVIEAVAK